MRVVQWDEHAEEAPAESEDGGTRMNAMRSWLVSGVHLFVVDPRRRFGSHGHARELLVVERPVRHEASERWQTLAAALHRHSVRDGLARLNAMERRLITLAYLEGRTNREIAAMLGVSVSTVRRRLWLALDHLDTYLRRTGAWLAALALAALAYVNWHVARAGRLVGNAGAADRSHWLVAALTASALGVAAVGLATMPGPATAGTRTPSTPPPIHIGAPLPTLNEGPLTAGSSVLPQSLTDASGTHTNSSSSNTSSPGSSNGCHGNPTSAAPPVPVGSPTQHPLGAPVTHPSAGGCKAL